MNESHLFEINGKKYSIAFVEEYDLFRVCEYRKDLQHYISYTAVKANNIEEAIAIFEKRELERGIK